MAFIRTKKVKKWKYAYLVENKWKSKKTKQKVKQYLGRVHKLDNIAGAKFEKKIGSLNYKESIKELIKFEFIKNGFEEQDNNLVKDNFLVNLENPSFSDGKKPVVFEANEGFICESTFNKVINFKKCETEEETGLKLAESILEAGISLPHETFVKVFEKIHKTDLPVVEIHKDL